MGGPLKGGNPKFLMWRSGRNVNGSHRETPKPKRLFRGAIRGIDWSTTAGSLVLPRSLSNAGFVYRYDIVEPSQKSFGNLTNLSPLNISRYDLFIFECKQIGFNVEKTKNPQ